MARRKKTAIPPNVTVTFSKMVTVTGSPKQVADTLERLRRTYFVTADGAVIFDPTEAIEHKSCLGRDKRR